MDNYHFKIPSQSSEVGETIGDEEIEHFFPVEKISLDSDDFNLL